MGEAGYGGGGPAGRHPCFFYSYCSPSPTFPVGKVREEEEEHDQGGGDASVDGWMDGGVWRGMNGWMTVFGDGWMDGV